MSVFCRPTAGAGLRRRHRLPINDLLKAAAYDQTRIGRFRRDQAPAPAAFGISPNPALLLTPRPQHRTRVSNISAAGRAQSDAISRGIRLIRQRNGNENVCRCEPAFRVAPKRRDLARSVKSSGASAPRCSLAGDKGEGTQTRCHPTPNGRFLPHLHWCSLL